MDQLIQHHSVLMIFLALLSLIISAAYLVFAIHVCANTSRAIEQYERSH